MPHRPLAFPWFLTSTGHRTTYCRASRWNVLRSSRARFCDSSIFPVLLAMRKRAGLQPREAQSRGVQRRDHPLHEQLLTRVPRALREIGRPPRLDQGVGPLLLRPGLKARSR